MKHFIILMTGIFFLHISAKAQTPSCCSPSSSEQFAAMASGNSFISAHDAPLPFNLENPKGKMITFETAGGPAANAYEVKSPVPSNKVVIMIHEWWGLNDYIKQEAEKLQAALGNVTVIAIDMYDGKVAGDPKEASKLVQGLTEERTKAIINGVIKYAGPKAKLATMGWCFGGGVSLQTSLAAGKQSVACVMYYGMPETDLNKLKTLQAPVLGIFGTQDKHITPELVSTFEKNMKACGKKITVKNYDADHAFANPSNPHHDAKATEDAYGITVKFLKEKLG